MKKKIRLPRSLPGLICGLGLFLAASPVRSEPVSTESLGEYELVWADEFSKDGPPSSENWIFEHGFVRNKEAQWYQPDNAWCEDGMLIIEARRERVPNPGYAAGSDNWKKNRRHAEYTSSCVKTLGLHEWTYGRFEARGRFRTELGMWPTFWTLGSAREWPGSGEIDIMEFYQGKVRANACWQSQIRWVPHWDSVTKSVSSFPDPEWAKKFHVYRMDWDSEEIRIFLDDELMNTISLKQSVNGDKEGANPFTEPQYILLNLAIGGGEGGDPSKTEFPARFEVDYVRVYQKRQNAGDVKAR